MTPRVDRNAVRIEITLTPDKAAALDEARGNEARASFIKRVLDNGIAHARLDLHDQRVEAETVRRDAERVTATQAYLASVGPKPAAARKPRPKGKR